MDKTIIDITLGTETVVALTDKEIKIRQALAAELAAKTELEQGALAEKQAARQSALDKLSALGLSVEEISAITGA